MSPERDPYEESDRPETPASLSESAIENAVGLWVDRLIEGEELDPLEVISQHPGIGHEVLDRLESFVGLDVGRSPELQRLGDFRIVREIGRGGMGVVYEAHQESMDRRVALKILPAGVAADRTAFLRFLREAQTAGKLHHPAIVGVHSLGIESGTPYFAMEHVEGETLASVIAARRRGDDAKHASIFTPGESGESYYVAVAKLFARVAEGLYHAHREGVIHRDVKPSNLMFDAEGNLRILDFGLAYFEDLGTLTLTGEVVGTPFYMSPEQARRETIPVDHRTDIYSLGATLYEVLTLTPPFRGRDRLDTIRMVVQSDPPPIRAHDPFAPRDLETIVLKCMRKQASSRYSTAEALAQDLQRFVKGEPIEARPEGPWMRVARRVRRHRTGILATTIALVALGIVAWLVVLRSQAENERRLAVYPGKLRDAVGKLDSGSWVLQSSSPPVEISAIDFRLFEPIDFQDVMDVGGTRTVREAIRELEALALSCPSEAEPHFQLARAFLAIEHEEEAVASLDRALAVDSDFIAAVRLRRHLVREKSTDEKLTGGTGERSEADDGWMDRWRAARWLLHRDSPKAEKLFTELIERFEIEKPPYTGFLTECYLRRAESRLRQRAFDLAEEDCVRARARNPSSESAALLLGTTYLAAGKPALANAAFDRLSATSKNPEVLPFWIVSAYLKIPDCDLAPALRWASTVGDSALRERLTTYLHLRLGRWEEAVLAGRRAVAASPDELVPRQLLACSLVHRDFDTDSRLAAGSRFAAEDRATRGARGAFLEAARACRRALALDVDDRRSKFLLRAAWQVLTRYRSATSSPRSVWGEARDELLAAADEAGLRLPADELPRVVFDEFRVEPQVDESRSLRWRLIDECCSGTLQRIDGGLQVAKKNSKDRPGAWLVTEEVFSGDVCVETRVDIGETSASCNLHVDLGTVSLYYAKISRDGTLELGRFDNGKVRERKFHRLIEPAGEVHLELCSSGDSVECRVWPEGAERPDVSLLQLEDGFYRFGSIGISTDSHPATFRWVRVTSER